MLQPNAALARCHIETIMGIGAPPKSLLELKKLEDNKNLEQPTEPSDLERTHMARPQPVFTDSVNDDSNDEIMMPLCSYLIDIRDALAEI